MARDILLSGAPLIYPTETFYAIGCLAFDEAAIEAIARVKKRPATKPFPMLCDSAERVFACADESAMPKDALKFWPGPLTVVLPAKISFPQRVRDAKNKIAIRVTSHPIAAELSRACGIPLISTSANLAGGKPPRFASEIGRDFLAAMAREKLSVFIVEREPDDIPEREASAIVEFIKNSASDFYPRVLRARLIDKIRLDNKNP